MAEDKKRNPNFTNSEKSLLIKLANNFKRLIENKRTDSKTWKKKEEAWSRLTKNFNSSTSGPPRTSKQLIDKYKAIKKELKKAHSSHLKYTAGTGGGPYKPPPVPASEEEKELIETIKLSIEGLQNSYDSDGLCGISGIPASQILEDTSALDEIEVDWSKGTASLWQTPKHPKLKIGISEEDPLLDTAQSVADNTGDNFEVNEDKEQATLPINDEHNKCAATPTTKVLRTDNDTDTKSWASRRRPVIPKKKSVTSVAGKFEIVAERKLELIEIQKNVALSKSIQDQKEHALQMEILQQKLANEKLKTEILKKGSVVFEF